MTRKIRQVDADGNLQCGTCKEVKPCAEFTKTKQSPSGFSYRCRTCSRAAVNTSARKHKARKAESQARYRDENREALRERDRSYYQKNKERFRAKYKYEMAMASKMTHVAISQGEIPPIKSMYCVRCGKPAKHYHHQSYMESDRLCVVPACLPCHFWLNRNRIDGNRDLGIVPTSTGIVRIAISGIS